jgi:hypothetical protein
MSSSNHAQEATNALGFKMVSPPGIELGYAV